MDNYQSTIRAFNKVLSQFTQTESNRGFSEEFAFRRLQKKFEEPNASKSESRKSQCWDNWLSDDRRLHNIHLPPGEWYSARSVLHRVTSGCSFRSVEFPKGSEFTSTRGSNSIEARLCSSDWTCTYDNFEAFAKICYRHKALKRAAARRYDSWFLKRGFVESRRESENRLFRRFREFSPRSRIGFDIFSWKLSQIVTFTHGSRFATVPKNNEKDRPINIEPFGNILVQRSIGIHLRKILEESFGTNLDTLADEHRRRIADDTVATIDLKNASDSIALSLVEFLFPKHVVDQIMNARSAFILGPDGNYHQARKVSSMGNGFTFELMTLILTAVCRVLDPCASVFGDDIIIAKDKAPRLIELLNSVGFVVNEEKSFIEGPFRESCGANYHDDHGYIESYDFLWNHNIHDCIVTANKVSRLARIYPSFQELSRNLQRTIPVALRGGYRSDLMDTNYVDILKSGATVPGRSNPIFSSYFHTGEKKGNVQPRVKLKPILKNLHLRSEDVSWFYGFEYKPTLRSDTVSHLSAKRHWAKYEMYLFSGRVAKDTKTGSGR